MAAAAGLRLVPRDQRNPELTTTYGVGELVKLALDEGAERILFGCGDSGTNDAGIGLAQVKSAGVARFELLINSLTFGCRNPQLPQALGFSFKDEEGNELGFGSSNIPKLHSIDMSNVDERLANVQIDAALNHKNILCGPNGVSRVYGPQKGASPEQVEEMSAALDHFATVVQRDVGKDVALIDGGGASGGLGSGIFAFLGGSLHPRFNIIMHYLGECPRLCVFLLHTVCSNSSSALARIIETIQD